MKRDQGAVPDMPPPQPISLDVLREKYLKPGEASVEALFDRVAAALASVEAPADQARWTQMFRAQLEAGGIGAGRIMSAAGTGLQATLINCFVQPVGDCIQGHDDNGLPGIYEALREAAETMRRGGGVGYDFSHIRPKGARVRGTGSLASGPCSYINVFDQSCATVESAGARRGAQMGVLRIDHPDVLEFVQAKRTSGRWNNFNVSVAVTDAFMMALAHGHDWELVHCAEPGAELIDAGAHQRGDGLWVYGRVAASELWARIMQSAYDFAEPGILFIDRIRLDNNLRAIEVIEATNPCGEQPLPAYGCCDLGPIILPRFVHDAFSPQARFDMEAFKAVVGTQVRLLDNVLDLTVWPLPQQAAEARAKRRIGVGFTGLGNTLTLLGLRYDQAEGRLFAAELARTLRDTAYAASVELARERGAFPCFEAEQFLQQGTFASRLPAELQALIREHGIRNSHLLSIAPTGTVSLAFADNASNGIEPAFSWTYTRRKREPDGSWREYPVEDHAWRRWIHAGGAPDHLPAGFVTALEMSADSHLAMMEAVQPFIDTAISKTVNVPQDYPFEDFRSLYQRAWQYGLKGLATYRPNSIIGSVLSVTPAPDAAPVPSVPTLRSTIERRPEGQLPAVAEKIVYYTQQGQKTLYVVVSFLPVIDDAGRPAERAIEFFMPVGQSGESQQWITAAMRMLSLAARGGFLDRALDDMRKVVWDRGPVRLGEHETEDGRRVPRWHESEVAAIAYALQGLIAQRNENPGPGTEPATDPPGSVRPMAGRPCPSCGAHALIRRDGCEYCTACGHLGACG